MDSADEHEPEWLDLGEDTEEEIQKAFSKMLDEANRNGLSKGGTEKLRNLLHEYRDIFRLRLGNDPPRLVESMEVVLRPDYQPIKCKFRPCSASKRNFFKSYAAKLCDYGMIVPNNRAQWLSPPLIVPKKGPAKSD